MRLKSSALLLMAVCAFPAFSAAAKADVTVTPVITMNDVQALLTAGKYPECIQKIGAMLVAVPAPSPEEKAALLNMKAECLLQEKDLANAPDAFTAAATAYGLDKKLADKKSAADSAALCNATAELIKKSSNFLYTPKSYTDKNGTLKLLSQKPATDKTPAPAPIDIVSAATRPQAFTALFDDEYLADQAPLKALQGKNAWQPVLDFAPQLADLDSIEIASTGADAKTAPMEATLYTDANSTLTAMFANMQTQLTAISTDANTVVNSPANPASGAGRRGKRGTPAPAQQPTSKKKGLSDSDLSTLNDFITQLKKLPDDVNKTVAPALAPTSDHLKPQLAAAATLQRKIQAAINNLPKATN